MARTAYFIEKFLNILVLLASFAILFIISIELLPFSNIFTERFILNSHLIICATFFADFLVRWYHNRKKKHFIWHNLFFLFVSIPYLNIAYYIEPHITHPLLIFLRLIPLVRGIYGVAIIFSWITRNRATGLFATYVTVLFTTIYFCSIMFYFVEHTINPAVKSYWDAFVWALMNVTTVGSNIFGITKTGQSLAVVLSASGMIFFPIFTAYVITIFQKKQTKKEQQIDKTSQPET